MKDRRSSRCFPTSGCLFDSLLSMIPTAVEDNRSSSSSSTGRGSNSDRLKEELNPKKSRSLVVRGNSRFPSVQSNKHSLVLHESNKRSLVNFEPTGLMALMCQNDDCDRFVQTTENRRKKLSSPKRSDSMFHSQDVPSGLKYDTANVPLQKSVPRKSLRILEEKIDGIRSVEEENENHIPTKCNPIRVNKLQQLQLSEQMKPTNLVTPSPKRKLHQIKGGDHIIDMTTVNDDIIQISSRKFKESINMNKKVFKRKIRVRSSRKNSLKRLTLALTKSVTVGKKTIPSRSTVALDVRPIARRGSEDLNEDPLGGPTSQSKRGTKEVFIGIPPHKVNQAVSHTKKNMHTMEDKDTVEEWSKKVDDNRKNVLQLTSMHQHQYSTMKESPSKEQYANHINTDRKLKEMLEYMNDLILQLESLRDKVQKNPDADLVPLEILRTNFPLFTEMDIFLKPNQKHTKKKAPKTNAANNIIHSSRLIDDATSASPSVRKSKTVPPSSLTLKRKRTLLGTDSISEDDESIYMRRSAPLSDSDDSSIESNESRKYAGRKFEDTRPKSEGRTHLFQHTNTLMNIGNVENSLAIYPTNPTGTAVELRTISSHYMNGKCKAIMPETQANLEVQSIIDDFHATESAMIDDTDINDILERKWKEQDALALVVVTEKTSSSVGKEDEIEGNTDEEDSLSIFF